MTAAMRASFFAMMKKGMSASAMMAAAPQRNLMRSGKSGTVHRQCVSGIVESRA
jgi:hypothetical protein